MNRRRRASIAPLLLLLGLLAVPARAAGRPQAGAVEGGIVSALWQAVAAPVLRLGLEWGLLQAGSPGSEPTDDASASDLGPELDPTGSEAEADLGPEIDPTG